LVSELFLFSELFSDTIDRILFSWLQILNKNFKLFLIEILMFILNVFSSLRSSETDEAISVQFTDCFTSFAMTPLDTMQ